MAVDGKRIQPVRVPKVSTLTPGNPHRVFRFVGPANILLAAAIAAAPIWFHGPVGADDFEFHLISWIDAQHSWLHGIPYPHWAPSPNFGAGEPRFVFYPPLTWMLGAALGLILPWTLVPFAITFVLLAAIGFATRALARTVLTEAPATLAGCAAIFSAYTLFTTYDRTAFGEMAGGFFLPLLLLFALRDQRPQASLLPRALDGSTVPLALTIAGAWLSDAPAGVMACYLLAAIALVATLQARSWFPALRAAIAVVLGAGLTCAYLIPAAWEQPWVDIQQATGAKGDPGLRIENNWLFPHHTDPALHLRDLTLHWVSWVTVFMVGIALASLLVAWRRGTVTRRFLIPLAIIPVAVLLLQLPFSLPLWNLLPKLRFLQFPWRWLLAVEAPMGIFFAAAVWPAKSKKPGLRAIVACVCALVFVGATVFAEQNFFRDPKEDDDLATILDDARSGAGFVGTDEYAPAGAENTLVATGLPDACLTDDFDDEQGVQLNPQDTPVWRPEQNSCIATATATIRGPEKITVDMNDLRAGFIVLKLRRYPAWRVTVNGQVLANLQSRDDGLISVPVPEGPAHVTVEWTTTPDVWAGRAVSCLALLGLLVLGLAERRLARRPGVG
jgi:hypothetical protein